MMRISTSQRIPRFCVSTLGSRKKTQRRKGRGGVSGLLIALFLYMGTTRADDLLTEARFQLAVSQPISATVPRTEVRDFLRRISEQRRVAIVLDCRVDPHQLRDIAWVDVPLAHAIEQLAADIETTTSIVGDTFIIGPLDSLEELRTIIALRLDELEQLAADDIPRQSQLRRRSTISWQDLDRPGDLAQAIAESHQIVIDNPELISHDLWAGATVANANAVEQLSIILMQLDLAFEWGSDTTSIRLVPYPADVSIAKVHQPRGMSIAEAEAAARAEFPSLPIEVAGRSLAVTARVEEHERIEELIGIRLPRELQPTPMVPLARRTFTLTVVNQPVGGVIQALIDQGVPIAFDAEQLVADGADLSTKISLQLRLASIEDLMEELCTPAGLSFAIEDEQVLLSVE